MFSLSRRKFFWGLPAFIASIAGLGATRWSQSNQMTDLANRIREFQYKGYLLCGAIYSNLETEHRIQALKKAHDKLFLHDNPIELGTMKNPASERAIAEAFGDDYVYCRWNGALNNQRLSQILQDNHIKNVYLGRLVEQGTTDALRLPESYRYFITKADLKKPDTILTIDDYLINFEKISFWNKRGTIYENRSTVLSIVSGHVKDWIKYKNFGFDESNIEQNLQYHMVQNWADCTDNNSKAIVVQGIKEFEMIAMGYHEPFLIKEKREIISTLTYKKPDYAGAFLAETQYTDDNNRPSLKPFYTIYKFLHDPHSAMHGAAKEFVERFGPKNFQELIKNPRSYIAV